MRPLTTMILALSLLAVIGAGSDAQPLEHKVVATIELPKPALDSEFSIEKVLHARRSVRSYTKDPVTIEEVSQLLWAAYGITYTREGLPEFIRGGFKTAPSAGARYPLELYIVAGDVKGLLPGIYWYVPQGHVIHRLSDGDVRDDLRKACLSQKMADTYKFCKQRCIGPSGGPR